MVTAFGDSRPYSLWIQLEVVGSMTGGYVGSFEKVRGPRVSLLGLPLQSAPDWVAQTREIYCLTILEARSPRLRRQQAMKPPGKALFQASQASDSSLAYGTRAPVFTWCPPCVHVCPCVQISPFYKNIRHFGSEAHSTPG